MHIQNPKRRDMEEKKLECGHIPWGMLSLPTCTLSFLGVHVPSGKIKGVQKKKKQLLGTGLCPHSDISVTFILLYLTHLKNVCVLNLIEWIYWMFTWCHPRNSGWQDKQKLHSWGGYYVKEIRQSGSSWNSYVRRLTAAVYLVIKGGCISKEVSFWGKANWKKKKLGKSFGQLMQKLAHGCLWHFYSYLPKFRNNQDVLQ